MNLAELDAALTERSKELKQKESYFDYHMALVKSAPYTLTSLIVASVWSIVYEEPIAYIPIAIFIIIAVLTLYARIRATSLADTISGLSIKIGQIESRVSLRENHVRNGFQDALDSISNYYYRSWEMVRFEDWMAESRTFEQNWKSHLPQMIRLDMKYRHMELFKLMEDLTEKSAHFRDAANAFREKVKSVIDNPTLMFGVRDDQKTEWINRYTRALMLVSARGIKSLADVKNQRKLGNLDAGEEQALMWVFPEEKPNLWVKTMKNTDIQNLAKEAEAKRADAERSYLDIRQRIEGLYRRLSSEKRL